MSTPRRRDFAQVDVFSSTPYLGNPVAVVLDAEGLSDTDMARFARWTNLSETTYMLPATHPGADYQLRIFTPGGELPFAGHPTLGSAHAWLQHGGRPSHADRVVQQCGVGLVDVCRSDNILSFAAPPTTRSGPLDEAYLGELATALKISRNLIRAHQWVDNGPGWAVVQLASAVEVLALEPDLSTIPGAMVGIIGAYPPGADHAFEMRTFAPAAGVSEDPVCGSINASVGQWLIRTGGAPTSFRISQGSRVGRAGTIHVHSDSTSANVWVGGPTTTCIRGTVTL